MARGRRRAPDIRRPKASREPKRRFVIYCEGHTERRYFEALRAAVRDARIEIEAKPVGGVPNTVADRAVAAKRKRGGDSYERNDEIWAIFDRDRHPGYYVAIGKCEAARVGVGRSNPCFELWLVLHREEYDRPDGGSTVQRRLRGLCPDYDPKGRKVFDCTPFIGSVQQAEDRAERQFRDREKERDGRLAPPYTTVWQLTRAIRTAAQKFRCPDRL